MGCPLFLMDPLLDTGDMPDMHMHAHIFLLTQHNVWQYTNTRNVWQLMCSVDTRCVWLQVGRAISQAPAGVNAQSGHPPGP